MLQIKPKVDQRSLCPYCSSSLIPANTLWMGMHILVETKCSECHARIIEDIKVAHALSDSFNQIDLDKGVVLNYGLGNPPILESLKNAKHQKIEIKKEVLRQFNRVIILNCVDFLYGHCLLKLLNAQRHLEDSPEVGLILIIPQFLRWLVPDGTAEVWTVDIPLKNGLLCYPDVDEFVQQELIRFDEIYVSEAHSHPGRFDITNFTKTSKHDFSQERPKVTFIWRQDRPWCNNLLLRVLRKVKLLNLALIIQNWKIRRLFTHIRKEIPSAHFTVAGLGVNTQFPKWIEDCRTEKFDVETEKKTCQIYADSRLTIGIHGSNMLLPSAHSGMTIDLLPEDRYTNFAQDILYQEADPRISSFRYRYLPSLTSPDELAKLSTSMVLCYGLFCKMMLADKS